MSSLYKYFEKIPGWKEENGNKKEEIEAFLLEKCKDWPEEVIIGLSLYMLNEGLLDIKSAFKKVESDLDSNIKPKLDF